MAGRAASACVDPAVDALARTYWETYLELSPLFATAVGDPRYDDRLADPTPEGIAAARARFEALLATTESIDPATLTAGDRTTLSALRESLGADIAELRTGLLEWNVVPHEGVPADFLVIPELQRLETPADGQRMVTRWREMARYTDRYLGTLRRSLVDGRVACRAPTLRTVAVLEDILDSPVGAWPLLAPLAEVPGLAGWTTADRERFTAALRDAVEWEIRPAFMRLHDALVTEILPAARHDDSPGMCAVPGGPLGYRELIRMHTSLPVDAETLHKVGLDEIARIDAQLEDLGARSLGAGSRHDTIVALRSDPALYFASRDEIYDKAARCLERSAEAVPAWFHNLPRATCEIVRMPAHEEDNVGAGYYRRPAADGSRPGQFVINTSRPDARPRYEAEALAYHEGIPGHHLQVALLQELELPEFRRHLGPTAYFEGWGLYAERLAGEMGLYTGDLDRLGQASFDAWRAARLVVDTGLHAMGWTRQRAIDYLLDHTALSPTNAGDEVDKYIVLPGQALAYKTGQLELLRLREEARRSLGDAFDIRAFHDVVLDGGALPLPTLAGVVAEWATRRLLPA